MSGWVVVHLYDSSAAKVCEYLVVESFPGFLGCRKGLFSFTESKNRERKNDELALKATNQALISAHTRELASRLYWIALSINAARGAVVPF